MPVSVFFLYFLQQYHILKASVAYIHSSYRVLIQVFSSLFSGLGYATDTYSRLGEQPSFQYQLDIDSSRTYSYSYRYMLIANNKTVLFRIIYDQGEFRHSVFNRCQETSSSNVKSGRIHVILDPVDKSSAGVYELRGEDEIHTRVFYRTNLYILGKYKACAIIELHPCY